jgi:hypothetical protein
MPTRVAALSLQNSMFDETPIGGAVELALKCSSCGQLLCVRGRVVDLGWYKKWVEPFECPIHGKLTLDWDWDEVPEAED